MSKNLIIETTCFSESVRSFMTECFQKAFSDRTNYKVDPEEMKLLGKAINMLEDSLSLMEAYGEKLEEINTQLNDLKAIVSK